MRLRIRPAVRAVVCCSLLEAALARCGNGRVPPDVQVEQLDASPGFDLVLATDNRVALPDGAVVEPAFDAALSEAGDANGQGDSGVSSRDARDEVFVPPPEDGGCVPAHVIAPPPGSTTAPTQPDRAYVSINFVLGATRDAWALIGLDRDDRCGVAPPAGMPEATARACAPNPGAGTAADGIDGRDNAFAALVAPVLRRATSWSEANANAGITLGRGSIALRIVGAQLGVDSRLTVEWHRVLRDSPPEGARDESWIPVSGARGTVASEAYVRDSQFVARFTDPLEFDLTGGDARLHLRLQRAVLSGGLVRNPEGGPGALSLTRVIVSGLWSLADVPRDLTYLGLCPGSVGHEEALTAARNAADVLGTEVREPDTVCDAVTVGFGLDMTPVRFDRPRAPPADPTLCPPSGG